MAGCDLPGGTLERAEIFHAESVAFVAGIPMDTITTVTIRVLT